MSDIVPYGDWEHLNDQAIAKLFREAKLALKNNRQAMAKEVLRTAARLNLLANVIYSDQSSFEARMDAIKSVGEWGFNLATNADLFFNVALDISVEAILRSEGME